VSVLSFSKLKTFETCPAKYKYQHVDRLPTPKSDAMSRGLEIHKSVEDFLNGQREDLHPDIHDFYIGFFRHVRDAGGQAEAKFALGRDWKPTDWDDSKALVRGVIDILIPKVIDKVLPGFELKTGKKYPEHFDQMELYGMAMVALFPDIPHSSISSVYLDLRCPPMTILTSPAYFDMKQDKWLRKFDAVNECQDFIPTPNFGCRWCPFRAEIGGPCPF
jgi:hypothetical protein